MKIEYKATMIGGKVFVEAAPVSAALAVIGLKLVLGNEGGKESVLDAADDIIPLAEDMVKTKEQDEAMAR